jgi:excisionase family DNA binding protein
MTDLLTTHEAASYLRLSPRTLENWRVRGSGPRFHKFGDKVLYEQHDIDTWVAEQARTSTSDPGPLPPPPTPRAALHALPPRRRGSRAQH